jgi:hypothetical protein
MKAVFESSVFLRSLNFLRVSHPYALKYNLIYPSACAFATAFLFYVFVPSINVFGASGLLFKLSPFLAVIAPFFLASLAAVSTFKATEFFDLPFEMTEPVTLLIRGKRGGWTSKDVTPRYFLSLLFGYCCVVSLFLFLITIVAPIIAPKIAMMFGPYAEISGWLLLGVFLFLFYQMILSTLLGVYFLSDRIHRE